MTSKDRHSRCPPLSNASHLALNSCIKPHKTVVKPWRTNTHVYSQTMKDKHHCHVYSQTMKDKQLSCLQSNHEGQTTVIFTVKPWRTNTIMFTVKPWRTNTSCLQPNYGGQTTVIFTVTPVMFIVKPWRTVMFSQTMEDKHLSCLQSNHGGQIPLSHLVKS